MLDADIYLLYDLTRGMSYEGLFLLKETIEQLVKQGATVLFLTTDHTVTNNQTRKNYHFLELSKWPSQVDQLKETLDNLEKEGQE
jgi:hypothetical protein